MHWLTFVIFVAKLTVLYKKLPIMKFTSNLVLRIAIAIATFLFSQTIVVAQSDCNNAVTIKLGLNSVDNSSGSYWYKYVADSTCRVILNT